MKARIPALSMRLSSKPPQAVLLLLATSAGAACHHDRILIDFTPNLTVQGTITAAPTGTPVTGAVVRVNAFFMSCDDQQSDGPHPDTTGATGRYLGTFYYPIAHTPPCVRVEVQPPAGAGLAPKDVYVETPPDQQVGLPQTMTIDVQLDQQ